MKSYSLQVLVLESSGVAKRSFSFDMMCVNGRNNRSRFSGGVIPSVAAVMLNVYLVCYDKVVHILKWGSQKWKKHFTFFCLTKEVQLNTSIWIIHTTICHCVHISVFYFTCVHTYTQKHNFNWIYDWLTRKFCCHLILQNNASLMLNCATKWSCSVFHKRNWKRMLNTKCNKYYGLHAKA